VLETAYRITPLHPAGHITATPNSTLHPGLFVPTGYLASQLPYHPKAIGQEVY